MGGSLEAAVVFKVGGALGMCCQARCINMYVQNDLVRFLCGSWVLAKWEMSRHGGLPPQLPHTWDAPRLMDMFFVVARDPAVMVVSLFCDVLRRACVRYSVCS
jgi:hypothetical protein